VKRLTINVEMDDGRTWQVRATTADYIRYDTTARKQRPPWGAMGDNLALWEAFVAWSASRREGQYQGSWDDWLDHNIVCDGQSEDVDPTLLAASDDSLSS
jgi:hypothetical protein